MLCPTYYAHYCLRQHHGPRNGPCLHSVPGPWPWPQGAPAPPYRPPDSCYFSNPLRVAPPLRHHAGPIFSAPAYLSTGARWVEDRFGVSVLPSWWSGRCFGMTWLEDPGGGGRSRHSGPGHPAPPTRSRPGPSGVGQVWSYTAPSPISPASIRYRTALQERAAKDEWRSVVDRIPAR